MSANDYKRSQFEKYKSQIIQSQKNYANICKADYNLGSHVYNIIRIQR